MITSVVNHAGAIRQGEFARTNEMIFFVMLGNASPGKIANDERGKSEGLHWDTLRRTDIASRRGSSKGGTAQFYPIYVDDKTKRIVAVGKPLAHTEPIKNIDQIEGCTAVLPIRKDGIEMNWGLTGDAVVDRASKGYISVGKHLPNEPQKYSISYLTSGKIDDINSGKVEIKGYEENGAIIGVYKDTREMPPTTQWDYKTHDAYRNGTVIVNSIVKNRHFTFPKSVYAVEDCIRLFVSEKKSSLIVDFFAGSGTTLHAVNLLNAQDGGHRRCIMVTNNEVSETEAKSLAKQGYKPGDEEWEKLGIARYITWPRTVCSIEGHDVNGNPLKGSYTRSDIPMAKGFKTNAAYFKLGFFDKTMVALGRQFREMLPTLWMKNGCVGPCPTLAEEDAIPDMMILHENRMAILIDEKAYAEFREKVNQASDIDMAFIITDSEDGYREMANGLHVTETCQLYRDYLDNFRINVARR